MAKIIKQESYVKDRDKASQSEDTNNETDCPCYVLIFVPDCTMIPFFKENSPEPFFLIWIHIFTTSMTENDRRVDENEDVGKLAVNVPSLMKFTSETNGGHMGLGFKQNVNTTLDILTVVFAGKLQSLHTINLCHKTELLTFSNV